MYLEKSGFQSDIATHFLELALFGQGSSTHSDARIPMPVNASLLSRHIYPPHSTPVSGNHVSLVSPWPFGAGNIGYL